VEAEGHGPRARGSCGAHLAGTAARHGPQPRDYSYKMPRQMLLGALRSALSAKLRDGELKVVQAFTFADHKTRTRWAPWPSWKPAQVWW